MIFNTQIESDNQIIKIKSQRNVTLIIYKYYIYNYHSKINDIGEVRYRCQCRKCKGALIIKDYLVISQFPHNHDADPQKSTRLIKMHKIRTMAKSSNATTQNVLNNVLGIEISNREIINVLPTFESIRDRVTRDRNKIIGNFPNILNDIPDFLKIDRLGRDFLRFDSSTNDDRFIIFIYEDKLRRFNRAKSFLIDGTFKSVPRPFYQLLILQVPFLGRCFPFCYILMSGKTQIQYEAVFKKLKEISKINPEFIITDFEKGLANSAINIFKCQNYFCYFHFGQTIWRNIQKFNLIKFYQTDIFLNRKFKNYYYWYFYLTKLKRKIAQL
ncbi:hypothetical protein DMUE_3902 [Dictyocoela muelleri]|nr:hypothetical protein DMUE_3902 [Dictyocoela muelleri]